MEQHRTDIRLTGRAFKSRYYPSSVMLIVMTAEKGLVLVRHQDAVGRQRYDGCDGVTGTPSPSQPPSLPSSLALLYTRGTRIANMQLGCFPRRDRPSTSLQSHCLSLQLADNRQMTRMASSERLGTVLVLQASIPSSFPLQLGVLNMLVRNRYDHTLRSTRSKCT